jgi:hypothetical protein
VSDVRPGARIIGPIRRTTLVMCALVAVVAGCGSKESPTQSQQRSFESPKAAVEALVTAVDKGNLAELQAIFGPDSQALIDSSDPVRGRRNQQVFRVAAAERWRLEAESPERNILVVGFEDWPFPIPLVKDGGAWRFDTAGGKEEILVRRIGHNELAAIRISGAYVAAQRLYAREGHDGKPRGLYARAFTSTDGRTACTGSPQPASRAARSAISSPARPSRRKRARAVNRSRSTATTSGFSRRRGPPRPAERLTTSSTANWHGGSRWWHGRHSMTSAAS